jgi:hypothetical protein
MPEYKEWKTLDEPMRMAKSRRLLRENPHIAAWHFHSRNTLFRDIVLKKKFDLADFWCRYEWQGRGSSHSHGFYWFKEAPLPTWRPPGRERTSRGSGVTTSQRLTHSQTRMPTRAILCLSTP